MTVDTSQPRTFVLRGDSGKLLQHPGSGYAYQKYGCRCLSCTAGSTERQSKQKRRNKK